MLKFFVHTDLNILCLRFCVKVQILKLANQWTCIKSQICFSELQKSTQIQTTYSISAQQLERKPLLKHMQFVCNACSLSFFYEKNTNRMRELPFHCKAINISYVCAWNLHIPSMSTLQKSPIDYKVPHKDARRPSA